MTDDRFAFGRGCGLGFILGICSGLTIWLGLDLVEWTTVDNALGCPHGVERQWQCAGDLGTQEKH